MKSPMVFVILFSFLVLVNSLLRFSNVKCQTLDPAFSSFSKCNLKMIDRSVVGLNVTSKLYKIPVTNVSVNFSVYKKSNGYNPYLFNVSVDFCNFLKNRQKYPLVKLLTDYLLRTSNVNHTCPFDHDIIIEDLVLDQRLFNAMLLPHGEYMLSVKVAAYNSWKTDVKMYISI